MYIVTGGLVKGYRQGILPPRVSSCLSKREGKKTCANNEMQNAMKEAQ
jgi:hypothetical protein